MNEMFDSNYNYFQPYLDVDEQILWQGTPGPGKLKSGQSVPILFGVVWLAFSLFWESLAVKSGQIIMILFGLPFVLIGFGIVFGGPIKQAKLKGKIAYEVTDRRLLVREGESVRVFTPDMLPPMQIRHNKNGTSSIIFMSVYHSRGRQYSDVCVLCNLTDVMQAQNALNRMMTNHHD